MELEKFDRQLRLMAILTQNRELSIDEVSKRTGMSKRTIYRYLEAFKAMGFVIVKEGTKYRLDHRSPFFRKITASIHFTDDEAITINQVLNSVYDNSPQIRHLREKLAFLYDDKVLARHGIDQKVAENLSNLYRAVREERVCVLHDYTSPHSGRKMDRVVEPFLFLSENTEVRCYEMASEMNKTFKISRAASVEVLDLLWSNKQKHRAFHTDLFHFSGEQFFRVRLLLGWLSANLLREEFPAAENMLQLQDDGRFLLDTEVCSFKGIGRFVIGLFDDIEIVDSPEFDTYIQARLNDLVKFIKPQDTEAETETKDDDKKKDNKKRA